MLRIVCHGGAGQKGPRYDEKNSVVRKAAEVGMILLRAGRPAVEAVEAAISLLEDDPLLNAGTGSYVQLDGMVRMDASIMDQHLNVGSVIGIHDVKNPIQVARKLMELSVHSVLEGDLATEFARSEGFESYDPRTMEKLELWLQLRKRFLRENRLDLIKSLRQQVKTEETLGTVGCVAMDDNGFLAAGTSTGGLMVDLPGRVGDVPLIGCGTYANPHAGVSCTGTGEYIIKVCLAKTVADHVRGGLPAGEACRLAIEEIGQVRGHAGVICIDRAGRIGHAFNTEGLTFCELQYP
ncbi:MAG: isoaspartyl peptidase/L-asparaginase [Myxococcales bacterium]|nr:isoaspartyl peptidase/L-asparaginase [Myxococcales bacterium]